MRLLLTQRRNLERNFLDIENTIRHLLKAFGVRLKGTSRGELTRLFARLLLMIR
jgi:transposase